MLALAGCAGLQNSDETPNNSLGSVLPSANAQAADAERRGDWDAAARDWRAALDRQPDDRTIMLSLARALRLSGNCGQSMTVVGRMLTKATNDAEALVESAKCHLVSGRPEAAETQLVSAIELAPDSWEAETTLGVVYDSLGRFAEAQAHHDRALALAPDKSAVISNKALSLSLGGRLDEAVALMRRAAAQPDAPARVRMNLAMLEAMAGNGDRASTIAAQETIDAKTEKLGVLKRVADGAKGRNPVR